MITLPGLIDPHVHLRTPGQTQKEDFYTGTCAALSGGYTTILDMPNNAVPITTKDLLEKKIEIAKKQTVCDIGFHFGSLGNNLDEFSKVKDMVYGLKLYLNKTTGNFIIDNKLFEKIAIEWSSNNSVIPASTPVIPARRFGEASTLGVKAGIQNKTSFQTPPILIHAEEDILEKALIIAHKTNSRIHVCHISTAKELQFVINAKQKGWQVTCGVTPHHLFLTNDTSGVTGSRLLEGGRMDSFQVAAGYYKVKPFLKPQSDVLFLWQHLKDIDLIESDHAPHTKEEKEESAPFGLPGLETTLPLLLTVAAQNKITIDDIIRLCHDNPAKIFGIQKDPQTYIEVDENEVWTIKNEDLQTKCGWSPFNGWKMKGKVKRVFIQGTKVFEDGKILVEPGSGKILKQNI